VAGRRPPPRHPDRDVSAEPAAAHPTLSVVITTYQHARFLGDALESVRSQQIPDLDVVVVDDGSTDRPEQVVARFPGVRLIRQDNRGLSAARNTGLAHCTRDYVIFLDADDTFVPGGLTAGLAAAAAHPQAAVVYGAHVRTGPDGRTVTETRYIPAEPDDSYRQFLQCNPIGMHGSALLRRTAVIEAGGFDEGLPACEDYDLYLRLAARYEVRSHPAVVAAYRIHDSNMSTDTGLMLGTVLRVLARRRRHVRHDPDLRRALNNGVRVWLRYYGGQDIRGLRPVGRPGTPLWRAGLAATRLFPATVASLLLRRSVAAGRRRARSAARVLLPPGVYNRISRTPGTPAVGRVRLGDLDRTAPISRVFGYDRGGPVDRYYIEGFLARHQTDIRGRVLEVGDDVYTRTYGGDRVERRDVLHVHRGNPLATFVGDLAGDNDLPSDSFDCVILTQTLQLIFDVPAALATVHRILRPGGVLLATVPGISNIDPDEWGPTWYWSFTDHAVTRLAAGVFRPDRIEVTTYGNVKAAVAFLHGLAAIEVDRADLDIIDPCYQVVIGLRAARNRPDGNS
jgi:glycosyltransferase involved in cell wall biosynthesis/SAM-dependent methyltransferase